jgi:hypothetical protein
VNRPAWGQFAGAVLFFLAATILFTWPAAAHLSNSLSDPWDARLNAWILHWDFHQTFHDPGHLFDANIFYPARYALAFSENLLGASLFGFPLYAAGLSTLTVYNVLFLLGIFLSALAAWALAREWTGDPRASLLAGVVYAFLPWRIAQIPHIQFQWGAFLALLLLFLLRYLDSGRPRDLALFGLFFAWNAATNVHYGLFSVVLVAIVLAFEGIARRHEEIPRRIRRSLAAAALAMLVVAPLSIPYARASRLYGMRRGDEEIEAFSAKPSDFAAAGPQNRLYGSLAGQAGRDEGNFFPGVLVPMLAALGVVTRRDRSAPPSLLAEPSPGSTSRTWALDLLVLALLVIWILAAFFSLNRLGPVKLRDPGRILVLVTIAAVARLLVRLPAGAPGANLRELLRRPGVGRGVLLVLIGVAGAVLALGVHTPYYRFLLQSFGPPFRAIRVPARAIVLLHLALAILAAVGLSRLAHRRRWIIGAAILVVAIEYRAFPLRLYPVPAEPAPVYRWLSRVELSGAILEWPFASTSEVEYQFRSTAHWKPLLNGYSGFSPPAYWEMAKMFEAPIVSPGVWSAMEASSGRLLIFHPQAVRPEERLRYRRLVREGLLEGRISPITSFANEGTNDLVFRIEGGRASDLRLPAETGEAAGIQARRAFAVLDSEWSRPFGYLDRPTENETVLAGSWGFGWALQDSGIEKVLVSFDAGTAVPATTGIAHPGVPGVYPGYPDVERAGFAFRIPVLAAGAHTLRVTLVDRSGGRTQLVRQIVSR